MWLSPPRSPSPAATSQPGARLGGRRALGSKGCFCEFGGSFTGDLGFLPRSLGLTYSWLRVDRYGNSAGVTIHLGVRFEVVVIRALTLGSVIGLLPFWKLPCATVKNSGERKGHGSHERALERCYTITPVQNPMSIRDTALLSVVLKVAHISHGRTKPHNSHATVIPLVKCFDRAGMQGC